MSKLVVNVDHVATVRQARMITEPDPVTAAALAELAGILRTIKDRDFQIAGHTDNVPIRTRQFPSNWELSTARAVSVVKFLQESGVGPTHLSASGYAEFQPAANNETKEGKAANRRIEIVLMPNLNELPDLTEIEGEIDEKKEKAAPAEKKQGKGKGKDKGKGKAKGKGK